MKLRLGHDFFLVAEHDKDQPLVYLRASVGQLCLHGGFTVFEVALTIPQAELLSKALAEEVEKAPKPSPKKRSTT